MCYGLVAQLGAHHIRIVGVEGSNPFKSTNKKPTRLDGLFIGGFWNTDNFMNYFRIKRKRYCYVCWKRMPELLFGRCWTGRTFGSGDFTVNSKRACCGKATRLFFMPTLQMLPGQKTPARHPNIPAVQGESSSRGLRRQRSPAAFSMHRLHT